MRLSLTAALLALTLATACGAPTHEDADDRGSGGSSSAAGPEGRWQANRMDFKSNGISFSITMRIEIERDRFTVSSLCDFPSFGTTLEASASSEAIVRSGSIEVLEDDEQETRQGTLKCSASTSEGTVQFERAGSVLVLRNASGEPLSLTRL